MIRRPLVGALLLIASPALADDVKPSASADGVISLSASADGAMTAAANAFYGVYAALPKAMPDATGRSRYAAVLSPRLNAQLAEAVVAEARFARKVKGAAPPLIEGDIFTSQFEGATSWKVAPCQGNAATARCKVSLVDTPRPVPGRPVEKPVSWTDILVLANTASGWKVDDVIYDAGFAFGNTGKLSDTLQMAITEASP